MRFINLTPHMVTIVTEGENIEFPPSGTIARVSSRVITVGSVDGIPITATEFGEVTNLPEPKEDTIYIVSSLVAQRVSARRDVFIPNEAVRDEQGRIIGCRSLGRI